MTGFPVILHHGGDEVDYGVGPLPSASTFEPTGAAAVTVTSSWWSRNMILILRGTVDPLAEADERGDQCGASEKGWAVSPQVNANWPREASWVTAAPELSKSNRSWSHPSMANAAASD